MTDLDTSFAGAAYSGAAKPTECYGMKRGTETVLFPIVTLFSKECTSKRMQMQMQMQITTASITKFFLKASISQHVSRHVPIGIPS
jgi:hypothetical protein